MRVLVDSDVLIEVSRGRNEAVLERWTQFYKSNDTLFCSPITVAEIWHGARQDEHAMLERLFSLLICPPLETDVARLAGDLLRKFHRSHGLELGDALIAATAIAHDAELWTRNRRHYPMEQVRFY